MASCMVTCLSLPALLRCHCSVVVRLIGEGIETQILFGRTTRLEGTFAHVSDRARDR